MVTSTETSPPIPPADRIAFHNARKALGLRRARGGRGIRPQTFFQWHMRGLVGRDGMVVKLRAAKIDGTFFTTSAWLSEFLAALPNPPAEPTIEPTAIATAGGAS
jgi:hypothetical protein